MSEEIVENLKRPSAWFRVLFMAGFVVALYVTGVVLFVLMLAQILFSLITGSDNVNLRRLGAGLAEYVAQILAFVTYNSEEKPFPFAPFPLPENSEDTVGDAYAEYSEGSPTAANPGAANPSAANPSTENPSTENSSAAEHIRAEFAAADAQEPEPDREPAQPPLAPVAPSASAAKARRSKSGAASANPRKSSVKKPVQSVDDGSETKDDV
jgi:hypothetical protein